MVQSILIWAKVSLVQSIWPSQTSNAQVSQAAHSPIKELLPRMPERKYLFSSGDTPLFIAFIKLYLFVVEILTSYTNVVFPLLKLNKLFWEHVCSIVHTMLCILEKYKSNNERIAKLNRHFSDNTGKRIGCDERMGCDGMDGHHWSSAL